MIMNILTNAWVIVICGDFSLKNCYRINIVYFLKFTKHLQNMILKLLYCTMGLLFKT